MLRRDSPAVDVLEGLAAAFVRARVRPLTAGAIHETPAPCAGFLRIACRTITGEEVIITGLEHHPISDQGGERPVERPHRHVGGRLYIGVGEGRQRRAPEDPDTKSARVLLASTRVRLIDGKELAEWLWA